MNQISQINKGIISLSVLTLLLGSLVILMKSSVVANYPMMDLAITLDLVLVVPVVYLLMIRKTRIPNTTVVPILVLGLTLGFIFLPSKNQFYLSLFKTWVLPLIEFSILTLIIIKIRRARKKYKSLTKTVPDFFTALKIACAEILPQPMVMLFSTEIAVIYYSFIDWKHRKLGQNEFSYHKKTGSTSFILGFIVLVAAETIGLHMFLSKWSDTLAWILTGLSMYTGLQLFGIARSLTKRPISLERDHLSLRYGILNESIIPYSAIDSITLSQKTDENHELIRSMSPFSEIEGCNVVINLNNEIVITGLYGVRRRAKTITLHVDDPEKFIVKLQSFLENSQNSEY